MKNGKEIFEMLYNDDITEDQCIAYTKDNENWDYILRDKNGNFNMVDLISKLLFKGNAFKILNQLEVESIIAEKQKQDRIKQLEAELERLKG